MKNRVNEDLNLRLTFDPWGHIFSRPFAIFTRHFPHSFLFATKPVFFFFFSLQPKVCRAAGPVLFFPTFIFIRCWGTNGDRNLSPSDFGARSCVSEKAKGTVSFPLPLMGLLVHQGMEWNGECPWYVYYHAMRLIDKKLMRSMATKNDFAVVPLLLLKESVH